MNPVRDTEDLVRKLRSQGVPSKVAQRRAKALGAKAKKRARRKSQEGNY